jgi:hypothetical protein
MVDFVHLKTLEDFKKAFDRTFSRVPLQDAHPEWPAEVRKAVAERRVIEGMTREQAAAVVGTPVSVETSNAQGVEVEVWHPRSTKGEHNAVSTGFPASLRFQGSKLVMNEPAPPGAPAGAK